MKRGFTLIELLAVIVILAIIALIAVPIVVNIINDAKVSSEEESLKLYEDVVNKMIVKKQMTDPTFNPSECKIKEDGNLECTVGTNKVDVEIEVKGSKPNKGKLNIEGNKISLKNIELNGKTYYETYAKLVNDVSPAGISRGDKYTYKVNDKDTFTFYVLSTEGDKVNLIMDRNLCRDGTVNYRLTNSWCIFRWYSTSDNTYGPITVFQYLYEGTKNWDNVPIIELSGQNKYTDEANRTETDKGYTSLEITGGIATITGKPTTKTTTIGTSEKPVKARLPKYSEVTEAECTHQNESCPAWLTNGLEQVNSENVQNIYYPDNEHIGGISGYWLLSSGPGKSNYAGYVSNYGYWSSTDTINGARGARPVITILKSDLP